MKILKIGFIVLLALLVGVTVSKVHNAYQQYEIDGHTGPTTK